MRLPFALSIAASFTSTSIARANTSAAAFAVNAGGDISRRNFVATTTSAATVLGSSTPASAMTVDPEYPGTAVERMLAVRARVKELSHDDLNGPWEEVRRKILWAGGLKDLRGARPGQGYTGHSFNDYNHVDLTTMKDDMSDNENDGSVKGIVVGNRLGSGIRVASIEELGAGGSWSTCMIGCAENPPQDVAHIQFRSRIAFKLVWAPNENFDTFVLVDDDGKLLATGKPSDGPENLPSMRDRVLNYQIVKGSKYAVEADKLG